MIKTRQQMLSGKILCNEYPCKPGSVFQTIIYLRLPLLTGFSHMRGNVGQTYLPQCCSGWGLQHDTVSNTVGELLPRLSTLTALSAAVYLCCTILRVASTGRYPAPLPYGARTFLTHFNQCPQLSGILNFLSVFVLILFFGRT